MTTETRTSNRITRTIKISAGLCVGALAMGSAAVLVSSPAYAGTLPAANAPTPTFTSDTTFTAPAGAIYEVPRHGFNLTDLQNVTIDGGTWVDPNTSPGDTNGHGAALGRAGFDIVGGSGITLENMSIVGANFSGGYYAKLASNAAINADGTAHLTVSGVNVAHVFGDCLTLGAWYQGYDPNVTVTPDTNATVTNFEGDVCGRQGIALVDLNGLTASNVTIGATGFESLDFESDTVGIGTKNATVTNCSLAKPVNISAAGRQSGKITISDCTIGNRPTGEAVIASNLNGSTPYGPIVFDNDTFACAASVYVSCFQLSGFDVTVENSSATVGTPDVPEQVYAVNGASTVAFNNDDVSGYFAKPVGTSGPNATVTVTGGVWQDS